MPKSCPSKEKIILMLAGRLDDDEIASLALHLSVCRDCQSVAELAVQRSDPLLAQLTASQEKPMHGDEAELHQALDNLAQLSATCDAEDDFSHIRDYRIIRQVGDGGMGTVYLAFHTVLENHVAIKLLNLDRVNDDQSISRFEQEIKAVGKLEHPNIVRALDAGVENGRHFLVMEYLEGKNLNELIRQSGPIPVPDACEIIRQAAMGVAHAHQNQMVHRDIKPSNLILTDTGTVKVLDLGLAQLQSLHQGGARLTREGQLMGTLDYMAPEQMSDSRIVDERTDVYSLGVTLAELLVGRKIGPKTRNSSIHQVVAQERKDVQQELFNAIAKMTERDPNQRFQSALAVAEILRKYSVDADLIRLHYNLASNRLDRDPAKDQHVAPPVPSSISSSRSSPHPRWPPITVIALLCCVCAVLTTIAGAIGYVQSIQPADEQSEIAAAEPSSTLTIIFEQLPPDLEAHDLIAVQLETGRKYPIHPGDNALYPGDYRLEASTDLVVSIDRFELRDGDRLLIPVELLEIPDREPFDFPVQFPKIPTSNGALVRYSGAITFAPQHLSDSTNESSTASYEISLKVTDDRNDPTGALAWLQLDIACGNFQESSLVLVDREHYNLTRELKIIRGWSWADTSTHSKRITELAGESFVVEFNPSVDLLRKHGSEWGLTWPEERISAQELFVMFFGARMPAAREIFSELRRTMGAERNITKVTADTSSRVVECYKVKPIPLPDQPSLLAGTYEITRSVDSEEIPFSFVNITVESPIMVAKLNLTDFSPNGSTRFDLTESELAALANRISVTEPPAKESFERATLPSAEGSWVKFTGTFRRGRGTEVPYNLQLIAHEREVVEFKNHRWIEIIVRSPRANSDEEDISSAMLLVNERDYSENGEFKIERGWFMVNRWALTVDAMNSMEANAFRWLDGATSQGPSLQEVLVLIFDAEVRGAGTIAFLRERLDDIVEEIDAARDARPIMFETNDGTLVDGQVWNIKNQEIVYDIHRSREIPFGFGPVKLFVNGIVDFTAALDNFRYEDPLKTRSSAEYEDALVRTQQELADQQVRLWKDSDGREICVGKLNEFHRRKLEISGIGSGLLVGSFEPKAFELELADVSDKDQLWVFEQHAKEWRDVEGNAMERLLLLDYESGDVIFLSKALEEIRIKRTQLLEEDWDRYIKPWLQRQ